jgi:DNA-3-methyladenine glycosylase II
MFEVSGWMPAIEPFDLRTSIRFLRGFGACKGDQILTDESLTKAIAIDGQAVVLHVAASGPGVDYKLWSDRPITESVRSRVCAAVDGYLSLSDDLSQFYALAADDVPGYAGLVRALNGLHQVRFLTVAEIGVWAVLSQRTPRNVSTALKRRITEKFGRRLTVDGVGFQAFPELTDLAPLTVEDWLVLVKKERKAQYLQSLVAGLLDIGEDYLREAHYDDATAALRQIRGVGEFTAAAILLRGLGRMDFVPLEMPAFTDATARIYGPGDHNAKLRARYGDHLGYWAYYLHTGLGALRAEALPAGVAA